MPQSPFEIFRQGDFLQDFRDQFDRFFGQFPLDRSRQHQAQTGQANHHSPATDISQDENAYRIVMEIPGIDPKNVEINAAGSLLSVRAHHEQDHEHRSGDYLVRERNVGTIRREFRLPDDVDQEKINAEFRNGVLALTLPKSQQAREQRRRIEIKTS
jgi:HSP20 family protein